MPKAHDLEHSGPFLELQEVTFEPFYEKAWERMQELRRRAEALVDQYWVEHHRGRQTAERRKERPLYGCHVRYGKRKITPYWFKYEFSNNRRHAYPQALKPSSYKPARYSMAIFHDAPAWEAAVIRRIEAEFVPIRGYAEFLSRFFAFLRANEFQALRMAGMDEPEVRKLQRERDERMRMFKSTAERAVSAAARKGL
ncbi:MAG: hypothetical protein EA356_15505 [Geminicoccaceae bacterium]|nr:MAG: hypothetical protein EA356_15505 [Geminicoccaceae bacterium]